MIFSSQFKLRVNSFSAGDIYTRFSIYLHPMYESVYYSYFTVYEGGSGIELAYTGGGHIPLVAGTWYTVKNELEYNEVTRDWLYRNYVDGTLKSSGILVPGYEFIDFPSVLLWASANPGIYDPNWSMDIDLDDWEFVLDGNVIYTDDFEDGDISPWVLMDAGDIYSEESGGLIHFVDAGTDQGDTRRVRYVPWGGINDMITNPRTKEIHHAYNPNFGDIKVQTFDPGASTPAAEVTVLTGQGIKSPSLEFDCEGKLVLLLSDGVTRKAAADPRLAASWQDWTIP